MSLTIDERLQGGWLVVGLAGDLDIYTAPELRAGLMKALTRTVESQDRLGHRGQRIALDGTAPVHGVLVDLSTVSFMDSAGLGVLVGVYQRAVADRTLLRLAGATEQVLRLFEMTGLNRVFTTHPSVGEAVLRPTGS